MTPLERCLRYVSRMDASISGAGGHVALLKAARVAAWDFSLPESDCWTVLREFNTRCQPAWPDVDIQHKIDEASRATGGKPRGWRLEDPGQAVSESATALTVGAQSDYKALASLRRIPREGVEFSVERGLLKFGDWHGRRVWVVTDCSRKLTELRRMDGRSFPAVGTLAERKSHATRGSKKNWPVGCREAGPFPCIALVEGMPDLLACHGLALWEQASHHTRRDVQCAPVAMLSGSPSIDEDALGCFSGKVVRIFPHCDKTGISGARKWQNQLLAAGAKSVDLFDFGALNVPAIKDLADLVSFDGEEPLYQRNPDLFKILPYVLQ